MPARAKLCSRERGTGSVNIRLKAISSPQSMAGLPATPLPSMRRAWSTASAAPTSTFFGSQPRSAEVPQRAVRPGRLDGVGGRGASWVADALMAGPALRGPRRGRPRAHTSFAPPPWAEGILADADFVADLLLIDEQSKGSRGFMA